MIQALLLCPAQAQEKQRVPENFNYPESPQIIKVDKVIKSKSMSGTITDPNGAVVSDVLVEKLEDNWGKRVEAVLTDSKGYFTFTNVVPGIYFLKLSKPGFDSMLLKVEVTTKKASSKLKIGLRLST
jgi:protocatechuate 3,4-dioxygenase beta subunit